MTDSTSTKSTDDLEAGTRMVKTADGVEYAFRWCPPGTFLMGSPENEEGRRDDETQHRVTLLEGFWMLETPVTWAMWGSVMSTSPRRFKGDDRPVGGVSWYDCQRFCEKLFEKLGMLIQLPTEAQWEYACRAGTTTPFNFGETLDGDRVSCSGRYSCPVRSCPPNQWGLYDMHGNVWEWCQDWFKKYPRGSVTDPTGPKGGHFRVNRGGYCQRFAPECRKWAALGRANPGGYCCRSAHRRGNSAGRKKCDLGFRPVAITDPERIAEEKRRRETEKSVEQQRAAQSVQLQETTAPNGKTRMVKTADGMEYAFRWCPPGTFLMGSPENEEGRRDDETPHRVTLLEGFWMLETPVTVEMFRSFMKDSGGQSRGDTPYDSPDGSEAQESKYSWQNPGFSQNDTHPAVCVSWNDAIAFCGWFSNKTGLKTSLPTEAQWEYACRAGTTTPFSFGRALNGSRANCNGSYPCGTNEKGPYVGRTTPVRSYAPNHWGLYDMHGNVWEWCRDWYGDYPSGAVTDPTGPNSGSRRIYRGGGWNFIAGSCRSASRDGDSVNFRNGFLGFRVVSCLDECVLS